MSISRLLIRRKVDRAQGWASSGPEATSKGDVTMRFVTFRLHRYAELAVLPGSDHFVVGRRTDWIISMTKAFLDAPMPKAK